jgi:hypothetical protein
MISLRRMEYKDSPILRATRPLTGDELLDLIHEIFYRADQVFYEDPRGWTNYDCLVGYLFGIALDMHGLNDEQYRQAIPLIQLELEHRCHLPHVDNDDDHDMQWVETPPQHDTD